jgi:hypothetical protein
VFDFVRRLMRRNDDQIWIEQRVRLTDEIWGRCDVAHWSPSTRVLTIVDYKNGYVGVDAEENEQLRIYAAASIYTHNLPVEVDSLCRRAAERLPAGPARQAMV